MDEHTIRTLIFFILFFEISCDAENNEFLCMKKDVSFDVFCGANQLITHRWWTNDSISAASW